jgi:serine/threonine protein kinase
MGVPHGDLKPENIVLNLDNLEPVLIDLTCFDNDLTSCGYQPPEYTYKKTMPGDIWSFGVILYIFYYLVNPFQGNVVTFNVSMFTNANASEKAQNVIQKCLSTKPQDRPTALKLLSHCLFSDCNR